MHLPSAISKRGEHAMRSGAIRRIRLLQLTTILLIPALAVVERAAEQTTGTPASPSAPTPIDGRSIPAESPAFGGQRGLTAKDSKPYWPPTVVPPQGAPNILLIMTDDAGFGVAGTFGGVIP